MNIPRKYYPNVIAVTVSLAFYALLFILLNLNLEWSLLSDEPKTDEPQQVEVDFQNDVLDQTPPVQDVIEKMMKTAVTMPKVHLSKSVLVKEILKDIQQNTADVTEKVEPVNKDSQMLAEIHKIAEELQKTMKKDSLQAEKDLEKAKIANRNKSSDYQTLEEEMKFYRSNYRTIYNLKKIYPYVVQTKSLVDNMNAKLSTMTDKGERKKLIKTTEKALFQQFEKDIRNMSTSQGKLLLKLIARETNQSGYDLIKTYKGTLPATFWYGVGLLFHEDLKMKYDSLAADSALEKVVKRYKQGQF
ncbi:MAG TPA: DUF4294 domain-containing protein [Paludibacter sp.]|nr:DUF4294 domain-containing protein [Paludibacter sp.]